MPPAAVRYSPVMPRRLFVFDPPDRFVAGTVGKPGSRTFFLQARRGGQIVSVVLEKVQVAVLAERLGVLLDELETRGISEATDGASADGAPLDEPINEAFRATTLTLGWDGDAERILVEARADDEDDDEDDDEAVGDRSTTMTTTRNRGRDDHRPVLDRRSGRLARGRAPRGVRGRRRRR